MPCERKPDIPRNCLACGAPIERKRFPSGLLETYSRYVIRTTCGHKCRAKAYPSPWAAGRSSEPVGSRSKSPAAHSHHLGRIDVGYQPTQFEEDEWR